MKKEDLNGDKDEIISHEFFIMKENNIYKIILTKKDENIIFNSDYYIKYLNIKEISSLIKQDFSNINTSYYFFLGLFEDNKVCINNKIKFKELNLIFTLSESEEFNFEIKLEYKLNLNDALNDNDNTIQNLKKEINDLKEKNKKLEEEIIKLKKYKLDNDNDNMIPNNIKLLYSIKEKSYADYGLDNTFAVFKSLNDNLFLVYSTIKISIILYDLKNQNLLTELKNCHNDFITGIRHYPDKINKKDIIMSVSNSDNNIKLWDIKNMSCILNLKEVNKIGFLYSACFLFHYHELLIISSNYDEYGHSELLKIFNLKGKIIKEIKKSNEPTFIVETYLDDILSFENYIITGNLNYLKSYNYNKNEVYHKYFDGSINGYHYTIVVYNDNSVIKLFESSEDGYVRIWHFHGGVLLSKIRVSHDNINGICLYNDKYIFVGCDDEYIKLIDIEKGSIEKKLHAHSREVLNIRKIKHPLHGYILISQAYEEEEIKIWKIDNSINI